MGKSLDTLGYVHPLEKKMHFEVARIEEYIKKGAQPSSTVARLLAKQGVKGMEQYIKKITIKPKEEAKKESAEAPQA